MYEVSDREVKYLKKSKKHKETNHGMSLYKKVF